ncbi:Crp/Fnr family transcriptional regulator [Flavobacterium sp. HJJ]|uniref:Crp/Fnr family transcriptional regulator n=1 Tax=Flavobacterium sp. HJJ TaxID=2783792 RepID=UPI00188D6CC8|nr:Crp/Fnr family transcriptional regulator [Flavobacterium sp. HJJ]MBF4472558.1 Crp/Fnr family transcriptional regulator [Flavobacterium sp. HJJ]
MTQQELKSVIQKHYSYIFEEALIDEIASVAVTKKFKEGDILIEIGNTIFKMPLLLEGAIKILREAPDQGELFLYFLEKGDTCAMSMACCMGKTKSEIRAVAETDGIVLMLPVEKMEEWLGKYKSWRSFVFDSYTNRMKEMLNAIDTLAFMNMNERLIKHLNEKAKVNQTNIMQITHQEIADELNTSRVVISRLLKVLEDEGKIKLNRNIIELL